MSFTTSPPPPSLAILIYFFFLPAKSYCRLVQPDTVLDVQYVHFIGFGIHQVSSSRKWPYRATDWGSAAQCCPLGMNRKADVWLTTPRGDTTEKLVTGRQLVRSTLLFAFLTDDCRPRYYAYNRLDSFIAARQCMTGSRLSQNDGRLLYLCRRFERSWPFVNTIQRVKKQKMEEPH